MGTTTATPRMNGTIAQLVKSGLGLRQADVGSIPTSPLSNASERRKGFDRGQS